MANKRETKMDGLAEILSALEKMGVDVKSEKLQNMIKKESQCIIDTAKSLAPADTGNMRNSIGFITKLDKDNRERVLIGLNGNYYNHYLGIMFEYGTNPRIQENGRYTIKGKNSFNNDYTISLSSSEYIDFSLQELREIKLNNLINKWYKK